MLSHYHLLAILDVDATWQAVKGVAHALSLKVVHSAVANECVVSVDGADGCLYTIDVGAECGRVGACRHNEVGAHALHCGKCLRSRLLELIASGEEEVGAVGVESLRTVNTNHLYATLYALGARLGSTEDYIVEYWVDSCFGRLYKTRSASKDGSGVSV